MTSKYSTNLSIPDELPKILKDFTREVLRVQPANIYQFGAEYFAAELEKSQKEQENGTSDNSIE